MWLFPLTTQRLYPRMLSAKIGECSSAYPASFVRRPLPEGDARGCRSDLTATSPHSLVYQVVWNGSLALLPGGAAARKPPPLRRPTCWPHLPGYLRLALSQPKAQSEALRSGSRRIPRAPATPGLGCILGLAHAALHRCLQKAAVSYLECQKETTTKTMQQRKVRFPIGR